MLKVKTLPFSNSDLPDASLGSLTLVQVKTFPFSNVLLPDASLGTEIQVKTPPFSNHVLVDNLVTVIDQNPSNW